MGHGFSSDAVDGLIHSGIMILRLSDSTTSHWPGNDYRIAHFARKGAMVTRKGLSTRCPEELLMNTIILACGRYSVRPVRMYSM